MDELWGNAWSDPHNDRPLELPRTESPPSWSRPNLSKPVDEEVDIGIQSWTPHNVSVKWNDAEVAAQTTADISWENMTLRKTPSFSNALPAWGSETQTSDKQTASNVDIEEPTPQWEPEPPASVVEDDEVEQEVEEEEEAHIDPVIPPQPLRSPSPDNFGTFETGLDSTPPVTQYAGESWNATAIPMEEDGWGSSWAHATQNEFRPPSPESEEQPPTSVVAESDWDRAQQQTVAKERVYIVSLSCFNLLYN